ncbi:MAG TPA: hypothetical protein VFK14_09645 [Solirubrobacterales bacterium]|nr:hypothetical protein [Solirubrobacterales bacterium]
MRRPGKKTVLLLLAALLALAVAGCGGGGGDTTEASTTTEAAPKLTKAELIEQGDDICAEVNAAVGALNSEPEESEVPATIEKTANLYTGMVERLQELGSPEGAESKFTSFMESAEELAKVEGEVKLAAEREDTAALGEAATEATPTLEEFQTQAEAYGFAQCSQGPGAVTPSAGAGAESGAEGGEEFEGVEEGGVEAEPEIEEVAPEVEEVPEEEVAPEGGGVGGAPEGGGGGETGGSSGGVGPG